jgi:hypothetical protein
MVIRVLAVPDSLDLFEFDEVFRAVLGWAYGQNTRAMWRLVDPAEHARELS